MKTRNKDASGKNLESEGIDSHNRENYSVLFLDGGMIVCPGPYWRREIQPRKPKRGKAATKARNISRKAAKRAKFGLEE